jgi:ADP-heptose:LPS heptosyltransferase
MRDSNPSQLFSDLLRTLRESNQYPGGLAAIACDLLTASDEASAREASRLFFSTLVEPLSDSFSARDASAYNRLFAQVIESCRRNLRATDVDRALRSFGLNTESDIVARADRLIREPSVFKNRKRPVKCILILSRVTLGADVAITSIIIDRLERVFSEAEIVLLGSAKLRELFGGDSRVRFEEIGYRRTGSVIHRLIDWTELLGRVRMLSGEFEEGECIVVDPDSRLTQLGLLPLVVDADYYFFPSRTYNTDSSFSLARLASDWLDELLGDPNLTLPELRLAPEDIERGSTLVQSLRQERVKPIATVNFGVGDNNSKRVGDDFEAGLISRLIERGFTVILDKGAGTDETARADSLVRQLTGAHRHAVRVVEGTEDLLIDARAQPRLNCDLFICSARIGLLAAIIRASDLYIGYDSAGQHIAAALGTPCIDVFAGEVSERFRQRWSPAGPGASRVVAASRESPDSVLKQTILVAEELTRRQS